MAKRTASTPPDPMPARIEPSLAVLKPVPPSGPNWTFEIKWDGYRLMIHKEPAGLRLVTRGGHDWTDRFPAVADAARKLKPKTMILDGEAVLLDDQGRPDFGALQHALGGRGGKRAADEVVCMAFDLLYLDGQDLQGLSLAERRGMLSKVLADGSEAIRLSEVIDADGAAFLKASCELGLEGIIAKRSDGRYWSGRKSDWIKIKCSQREGFVIIGYEPSQVARGGVGRLLLAARRGDRLVYVGGVGTGFSEKTGALLREHLDVIKRDASPASHTGKRRAVWVEPLVCAEIEFGGWTNDGKLRHSSFKGLRESADGSHVYELSRGDN